MSTRHSFLSTTGLLRTPSSGSTMSHMSNVTHLQAPPRGTKPGKRPLFLHRNTPPDPPKPKTKTSFAPVKRLTTRAGIVPLGPTFLVAMAMLFSLFFIASISFAFIGAEDEPEFRDLLNDIARNDPGIVLIGDNVDVDVDEPAITVRWSIIGCGSQFIMPGSEGSHGSNDCGIPSKALEVWVDSELATTFNPDHFPVISSTGKRLSVQNLFQFDSDHVLDVHEARLYPFDTYRLTSTIRVVDLETNLSVPLIRAPTLTQTSSFLIKSNDVASFTNVSKDDMQAPSRDLELEVRRPGEARAFALLLFGVSWMMAHATIAYLVLAWKVDTTERILQYLAFVAVTLLVIPQLRNAMPDAPGFDGVLIDSIGFFPQMLMTGFSLIMVLAAIARRELLAMEKEAPEPEAPKKGPQETISSGLRRMRGSSSSVDFGNIRASFSRNFAPPSPIAE
ncbi:hypothetical protein BXZ70DRAFT_599275 [Cristinia sonorae]|uniref:DUF4436 domain-containing protein n=1 Tax=Cristinia sonorae TaxID=1940300 RepID=A0A8K0UVC5_9AGAR|nr:hypothetical protein BXZ70DRAFT_599275 [Cristinia sonorae]